jgi:hypothetical protein
MKKAPTLLAISLLALLSLLPIASAQWSGIQYQYANGVAILNNDEIGIRVSALNQVPHFQWWNLTSPGSDYHVQFQRIFEANDSNLDEMFTPGEDHIVGQSFALPSTNWEFSGFLEEHQNDVITAIHFNYSNTDVFTPQGPSFDPAAEAMADELSIQIRVHFYLTTPQQFKFDIAISEWNWTHDDSVLVFQFTIAQSEHGQSDGGEEPSEIAHTGNKFTFGHAYMEYAQNAFAENGTHQVQVKGSHGQDTGAQEGKFVYLTFEHFEGDLDYDPILGIVGSDSTAIWDELGIDYNQLLLLAGGLSLVVLVIMGNRARH